MKPPPMSSPDLESDPDENWADYIDRLRGFEAPTFRLRRAQRRLELAAALERDLGTHRESEHLEVVEIPESVGRPGGIRGAGGTGERRIEPDRTEGEPDRG